MVKRPLFKVVSLPQASEKYDAYCLDGTPACESSYHHPPLPSHLWSKTPVVVALRPSTSAFIHILVWGCLCNRMTPGS